MSKAMKIFAVGVASTLVVAIIIAIVAVNASDSDGRAARSAEPVEAVCVINGGPKNRVVSGTIVLRQDQPHSPVTLSGTVQGLPPRTKHGFHVHESGDFRNADNQCISCGAHFNPHKETHGGPQAPKRHVGDLGNIEADSTGVAKIQISDRVLTLEPGVNNIVGRAIVVHEKVDDLGLDGGDSLNTGNAGARIGCCIIGLIQNKK